MTMAAAGRASSRRSGTRLDERSSQAVDLVTAEIGRFRQLVEDLLEISRYDAGAVRLDRDEVRLAEFVLQAVGASGHRDVPIELDAELAGVVVAADKRRLARVIANLLDNAAKYGDGATAVSLRQVDDAVQIAVEDSARACPSRTATLIFDRFARGGGAGRRGASEGVGLGLALVAEHVRLHGGRVWVEDRADGTRGRPLRRRAAGGRRREAASSRRRLVAPWRSWRLRAARRRPPAPHRRRRRTARPGADDGAAGHDAGRRRETGRTCSS